MATIRVVDRNGVEHRVEVKVAQRLMAILCDQDFGVAAICGGVCSCATCHVYVDEQWLDKLPPAALDEQQLLTELADYRELQSRLSCQLNFNEGLNGLRVTLAPDI